MENQLQRYSMANDGTFTINVIGARPFMVILNFNFKFDVGDLKIGHAKHNADFESTYDFKAPITDPIRAAHDLMTAKRFIDDWVRPMLNALERLFNESELVGGYVELEAFQREFGLKELQAQDTRERGASSNKANITLTGKF